MSEPARLEVSGGHLARRFIGWHPLVPFAVAVGLLLLARMEAGDARLLAEEGVRVEAEVMSKRSEDVYDNDVDRYFLTLQMPRGDDLQAAETEVEPGLYDSAEIGDRIEVTYAPSRPSLIDIEAGASRGQARTFTILAGLAALFGLAMIGSGLRRVASGLRAARKGERVTARVTEVVRAGRVTVTKGGRRHTTMLSRLRWAGPDETKGKSLSYPEVSLACFKEGSAIRLAIDPKGGTPWWWGDLTGAPADEVDQS
ncbi:hypothetical protein ACXN5S_11375 [Pseudoroseicyclus sp. H15]